MVEIETESRFPILALHVVIKQQFFFTFICIICHIFPLHVPQNMLFFWGLGGVEAEYASLGISLVKIGSTALSARSADRFCVQTKK